MFEIADSSCYTKCMNQKTILLLFGGESAEHDVSVMSARNVIDAVDTDKFQLELCYIARNGQWRYLETMRDNLSNEVGDALVPVLGERKFVTLGGKAVQPDVILPILHGPNGEDGTVQGLASLLHIPIVGCGVATSAVCMDKVLTKDISSEAGIPVVPYTLHFAHEPAPRFEDIQRQFGTPVFVKPANMGSSVGVSRVVAETDFEKALEEAHKYDNKVLIEQGIDAREIEVAMLGGGRQEIKASTPGEIKAQGEFYSYESKYDENTTSEMLIPADIPPNAAAKMQDYAKTAFAAVGGKGISRIDFFLASDGKIYLNEINTLPGFTNYSMYPKLWEHEGISYSELIELLVENALNA